ncbi:MAG: DUF3604 domain-containing protein [Acidobacteria bacterium]|nr:DUF3604 domain-containing protein [Acidobacteriota bacterium]
MKKSLTLLALVAMAGPLVWRWSMDSGPRSAQAATDNRRSFRIVFGDRQEYARDWSGRVEVVPGKVLAVRGWRFANQDSVTAPDQWKLQLRRGPFENQPDRPFPLSAQTRPDNILPAGVDITIDAPESATARVRGGSYQLEIPLARLTGGRVLTYYEGDVLVQQTPITETVSPASNEQHDYPSTCVTQAGVRWVAWQAYENNGDHVYARRSTASGWSEPVRLSEKADVYRTAIAEDGQGRIHVVWSERSGTQWHLYERVHSGGSWSARRKITSAHTPNMSHRLATDGSRNPHLVWIGYDGGQSYVFASHLQGDDWQEAVRISGPSAWAPEAAADSRGNLWVTWDSYRAGNYDIYLRRVGAGGALGPEMQVTRSPLFQSHPTIAIDKQDRIWLAWDESGANWGKDWSHEDTFRSTVLYTNRVPRVAVYDGSKWLRPAADLMTAVPKRYTRYIELPRIACDPNGRIWLTLELRTLAGMSRTDFWAANGRWEHFLTSLEGERWQPLQPLAPSSSRPEAPISIVPAPGGVLLTWTHDNRPNFGPGFYAPVPIRHQVMSGTMTAARPATAPALVEYVEPPATAAAVHADEPGDVRRIRNYRARMGESELRILRGDFHRHTEISLDGAGDGSVEDYFRYMLDAAAMDTGIVADHNAGNNDEYSWWRTEKAIDLYRIPGRYTPLFGYERSLSYPNGHRNVVFPQRGVRTLPFTPEENKGGVNSGSVVYPYLRKNHGIAMLHSLATGQGSDYRDNDPELEPLVELYQGYHASYEYEGAPRAESSQFQVSVHGGYRPLGFWWRALEKGLKLGVQASSDHIATHNSYTLIYTPGVEREEIVESMRKRHAYGATDNMIVDLRATSAGREYMMGDAFSASAAPRLSVKILGTAELQEVIIVKDSKVVYRSEPKAKEVEFTFLDQQAGGRESYYYVRAVQVDRNLAWSSPIWVKYN